MTKLSKLTHLDMFQTKFGSLSFLSEARALSTLILKWLPNVASIGELLQLKSLTVDGTTLSDLSVLKPLKGLEKHNLAPDNTRYFRQARTGALFKRSVGWSRQVRPWLAYSKKYAATDRWQDQSRKGISINCKIF